MAGNTIAVPSYQRAYSWDTPEENKDRITQTDVFLSDLEEFKSIAASYYFGHFLFEERDQKFYVIDGQQRLTTIVIFLSVLFARLKSVRPLREDEENCYEDMVKRRSEIRFSTVDYDDQLFKDYVIERTLSDHNDLETESARRIVGAYDFFKRQLSDKPEEYLTRILSVISKSTCTTHLVKNESEAIQMFIFQNNRGKRPSNLEIVKAQFMHIIHLHGGDDTELLIAEIKERFEKIYKSIASIEPRIDEDAVLLYTLKVHFNSLWETNSLDRINKSLSEDTRIVFIKEFTLSLSTSFGYLSSFFGKDERDNFAIHSLVTLGGIAIALPFILKAYKYALPTDEVGRLCASFENLVLRHRLIGTRADITSRLSDVFVSFTDKNKDIRPIIEHIQSMKKQSEWWWAFWNDDKLKESLQGKLDHSIVKYLLWKYECHLEQQGKSGYLPSRFNRIISPEVEHIAPTAEPNERPHGYDVYDDEFKHQYLDCLGNYLLLSKSHNCAVGHIPFSKKWVTYVHNAQQREIQTLAAQDGIWSKTLIQNRKDKIIGFIMANC